MNKIFLPAVILVVFAVLSVFVVLNPPDTNRDATSIQRKLVVETIEVQQQSYQIILKSYGVVYPRTQSQLLSQVSGQIISIGIGFRNGGFFEEGDLLVAVDPRDYQVDVSRAQANVIEMQQALVQEQAQVDQARNDWKRLGNTGKVPLLVLREPQFKTMRARVKAAEAVLEMAQANLHRAYITAPYAGRVLEKRVDVGQAVAINTALASLYATDSVEVRLPLNNSDLPYIDLPETLRFDADVQQPLLPVLLLSELGRQEQWSGNIIRTEGAIDSNSQQLHVIAQIDDPYGLLAKGRQPLKIGQYVTAQITAKKLTNVLVIPTNTIYQGSYVYLVEEGLLRRRKIDIAWKNTTDALVKAGLQAGDQLVITSLGKVPSGTVVDVVTKKPTSVNTNDGDFKTIDNVVKNSQ